MRWRLPPHWSRRDWRAEAESLAATAALEAERAFDPAFGAPREAFVYRRTLSALVARFRSEWYHARGASRRDLWISPGRGPRDDEDGERLRERLRALPEGESWLLRRLYWDRVTESALALEMGISQQAVSKRKRAAILRLREEIGEQEI